MSVVSLVDFKAYLRELSTALDNPLQMALDAAIAEASGFVGFDLDEAYDERIHPDAFGGQLDRKRVRQPS